MMTGLPHFITGFWISWRKKNIKFKSSIPRPDLKKSSSKTIIIPGARTRYLAEIADTIRQYHKTTQEQANAVRNRWHLIKFFNILENKGLDQLPDALEKFKAAIADAQSFVEEETDETIDEFNFLKGEYFKGRPGAEYLHFFHWICP